MAMLTAIRERKGASLGCWIARVAYFWQETRVIETVDMTREIDSVNVSARRVTQKDAASDNSERKRARGSAGCLPMLISLVAH